MRPWIGYLGGYPLEGPAEEECRSCGHTQREHPVRGDYWTSKPTCLSFWGWEEDRERDRCQAMAMVITEWICHACGHENDVWGEGALGSWMECGSCGEDSFLRWAMEIEEQERKAG